MDRITDPAAPRREPEDLGDELDPIEADLDADEPAPGPLTSAWARLTTWSRSPLLRRLRRRFGLRQVLVARFGGPYQVQTAISRTWGPLARGRCSACRVGRLGGTCLILVGRAVPDEEALALRCDTMRPAPSVPAPARCERPSPAAKPQPIDTGDRIGGAA